MSIQPDLDLTQPGSISSGVEQPGGQDPMQDRVQVAGVGKALKGLLSKPVIPEVRKPATAAEKSVQQTDVAGKVDQRMAAGDVPAGKPPEELFNWMRTGLPDDGNAFIDEAAKAIGVKTPEKVTHQQIIKDLEATGVDAKDLDWIQNYADNTEQMMRVAKSREILVSSTKLVQKLAQDLSKNPSPELALQFHQATTFLATVSRGVKNMQTDYARALGVMRATPTGNLADLEGIVMQAGGMDNMVTLAGKIANLNLQNSKDAKLLLKLADKSMLSKVKDIWLTTWINGLLSSPVTHAKNMLGNTLFNAMQVPEHYVAAGIGKARGLMGAEDALEFAAVNARVRGMVAGSIQAPRAFAMAFARNAPVTGATETKIAEAGAAVTDFGSYLGVGGNIGRALDVYGKTVTLPGRALLAEDEMFKVFGYYAELYEHASMAGSQARRKALEAGKSADEARRIGRQTELDIIDSPPADINAAAVDGARYMTFTNPLERGSVAQRFQDMANSNVLAKIFMPFVRTPVNLAVASLERTPFAPLTKRFREGFAAGGVARDVALARAGLGTMTMMGMTYLTAADVMTGGGPGGKGGRDALERQGWQPYSFVLDKNADSEKLAAKIQADWDNFKNSAKYRNAAKVFDTFRPVTVTADKVYISYQGIEPIGSMFAIAADVAEYARYQDDPELVSTVVNGAALGFGNYMLELPYMQGIGEFWNAISGDGKGHLDAKAVDRLLHSVARKGGEFLIGGSPAGIYSSLWAALERVDDPAARSTKHPKGEDWRSLKEVVDHYRSRVPGLSKDLPPRTYRFGDPIEHGHGSPAEVFNPIRWRAGKDSPIDNLWREYDLPRGDVSRFVSWSGNKEMHGLSVELTAEEHNALKRYYGRLDAGGKTVADAMLEVAGDPAFDKLALPERQALLLSIDGKYLTAARNWLVNASPFAQDIQTRFRDKRNAALSFGLYSEEVR